MRRTRGRLMRIHGWWSGFTSASGLVKAKRHTDAKLVENIAVDNPGLDVELPNGVKLLVNRQRKYVNLIITMAPLKSQDGCPIAMLTNQCRPLRACTRTRPTAEVPKQGGDF